MRPASHSGLTLMPAPGVLRVSFPQTPLHAGVARARAGLRVLPSAQTGRCSSLSPAPWHDGHGRLEKGRARGPYVGTVPVGVPPVRSHFGPRGQRQRADLLRPMAYTLEGRCVSCQELCGSKPDEFGRIRPNGGCPSSVLPMAGAGSRPAQRSSTRMRTDLSHVWSGPWCVLASKWRLLSR